MRVYFYALFIHLSLNIYIFYKGWDTVKNRQFLRAIYASFFVAEMAVYLTGLFFSDILPEETFRVIALFGASWMVFLFYMTLCWLLIDLLFFFHRKRNIKLRFIDQHPNSTRGIAFITTSVLIALILLIGNYNFRNPKIEQKEIDIAKTSKRIKSIRAVLVSDTHFGFLIDKKIAQKYVNLIMAQKPDIILFAGDIIDAEIAPILKQRIHEDLLQLSAPLGIYGCTGNHEYRYEAEQKIAWLHDKGHIKMLRDTAILVDSSFYIVGREDDVYPQRKALKTILKECQVDETYPVIVLNHSPTNLAEEAEANIDLALYGHTHEGQIFPFNLLTHLIFEVAHGYKKKENTQIYVTSGLGLSGPQLRIGTQSEIVVLTIKFN